jgi:hypothetical protein
MTPSQLVRTLCRLIGESALDLAAEVLSRSAERKAELLRRAQQYESEGLDGIALHLRQQADRLDLDKPLASALPALAHRHADADSERVNPTRSLSADSPRSHPAKSLSHSRHGSSNA